MPPEDQVVRYATVGGRTVAWSSVGSGPPLLVGGWWSSHLELDWEDPGFRAFIRQLAADRRVIRYDRPGTGLSGRDSPPPRTRDEEAAVLAGLVEHLGEERVDLVAASSGCPVVATYAATAPDRVGRLVLYGGYADGADVASPAAREAMLAAVRAHWGLGSRVLADVFMPGASAAERERFARLQRRSASREAAAEALRAVYEMSAADVLDTIRVPTLVLHRREDRAIPFALGRDLARLVPAATFVELDGDEHFPWRGDSGAVIAAIQAFLAGRDPRPPARPSGRGSDAAAPSLSPRELDVLRLVAQGRTDAEIADQLVLSIHTVHRHVANIRTRLGVSSRAAAAARATEQHLL